jgi:hypothetical protein
MAFSSVTVVKPINLSISVYHDEEVVLINMAMLSFFAAELYVLIRKHRLRSVGWEVPLHILLI